MSTSHSLKGLSYVSFGLYTCSRDVRLASRHLHHLPRLTVEGDPIDGHVLPEGCQHRWERPRGKCLSASKTPGENNSTILCSSAQGSHFITADAIRQHPPTYTRC